MGNNQHGLQLNQMGIAVMLFDPRQLPSSLCDKADLHHISEGKTWVLKQQAKVFLKEIKDPLLRKHFCTFGSGQGIVIRVAPAGKKGYYDLSPYFQQALKEIPSERKFTDESAMTYVQRVINRANYIRGQKRSGSDCPQLTVGTDCKVQSLSPQERQSLLDAARKALKRAYARYSNFRVGAAVLTEQGEIFTGCNVENASYGLTICAERSAIFTAVQGTKAATLAIRAVAVVTGDDVPCSPCGACRQVIFEFGGNAIVIFKGQQGYLEMSIQDLLPESFRLS